MTVITIILYNVFISPLFILASHIAALFHKKIRAGIIGRYQTFPRINAYFSQKPGSPNAPLFLFHCASMGEFEHIKPLLAKLKQNLADCRIVVMFFSPSGFQNSREFPAVDLFIYSPMDIWWRVKRLYKLLNPTAVLIAKHDVWPNQVWVAWKQNIPLFLINASLHETSSRIRPVIRHFQRTVYDKFSRILTITEDDKSRWKLLSLSHKIRVIGDTKYDQVLYRFRESHRREWFPETFIKGNIVFVAGSTWPEDEQVLFPELLRLLRRYPEFRVVICPHEVAEARLRQIEEKFADHHPVRYGEMSRERAARVIIIDRIGILANLYSEADIAYVGGSFRQNIHNVLEPAVYGIPVLFGPVNQNSNETQLLKQCGGGVEVKNEGELRLVLDRLIYDPERRAQVGRTARDMIDKHSGSTERSIKAIFAYLKIPYC